MPPLVFFIFEKKMGLFKGLSFSWKRALGISGLKSKIAHITGIPTTQQGLERKIGGSILNAFKKKK